MQHGAQAPAPLLARYGSCAGCGETSSPVRTTALRYLDADPTSFEGLDRLSQISFQRALGGLVLVVLLIGLVPAGLVLDRRVVDALEERARNDLRSAVLVLEDRFENLAGVGMMHAKELATSSAVHAALLRQDSSAVVGATTTGALAFPDERALVVGPDGNTWEGPAVPDELVAQTRNGDMPIAVIPTPDGLAKVALAPVMDAARWLGAVGTWTPFADGEAARLSALTRSDVLIAAPDRSLASYTGAAEPAMGLVAMLAEMAPGPEVQDLLWSGAHYFVAGSTVPGGTRVTFVRPAEDAMALVPALRGALVVTLGLGLLAALLVGTRVAAALGRPVTQLSDAAQEVAGGNLRAALPRTRVLEVDRMSTSFAAMRDSLAARIEELAHANQELADRQERLTALQAEFIRRDRHSSTSRLLVQLAHEIRNPVAGVRNALELLRRRVKDDPEATEFADLAIDELLRMHELAEHMLDMHRPVGTEAQADAAAVVRDVTTVVRLGAADSGVEVVADADGQVPAAIAPDALKQVVLNLVQNAREAVGQQGRITLRARTTSEGARVDVEDTGPGIADQDLPHLFDAFFTTKQDLRGVGLGLYIAEGVVRGRGGRLSAINLPTGGARFTIEVPATRTAG